MAILRMPKTIRWIGICAILLLALLSAYRGLIYLLYPNVFAPAKTALGQVFWYGLRLDGRIVGIITLLMFLTSFWPGKHYYKSGEGKKLALWLYGLLITGIFVFYLADIAYLQNFSQRLHGSLISDLAKNTEKGGVYKARTQWLPIIGVLGVVVAIFVVLINKLHRKIGKTRGTDNRIMRIGWQIITVIACLVVIYGRLALQPLTVSAISQKLSPPGLQLAINPVEALINSLPARKHQINTR